MYWYKVHKLDNRARLLADEHYSRQTKGHREFCAPGNNIVLIVPSADGLAAAALWVSQRPDPSANLAKPRADGFDYWHNGLFRNESAIRSSELILEAIAITKYFWDDLLPADGFHSFVDERKVDGVKVRGETVHGFCFMKAGFHLAPQRTKERGLLRWIFSKQQIEALAAAPPLYEQQRFSYPDFLVENVVSSQK